MAALESRLQAALDSRKSRTILRAIPEPITSTSQVDFYTSDYLSLASNSSHRKRFLERINSSQDLAGSGGSRLLVNSTHHAALESRLKHFFRAPSALLFNSGFDANVGFFSCIPGPKDVIIYDEYIHASVHDGMRASRTAKSGSLFPFAHNSPKSLSVLLNRLCTERPSLLTGKDESVFIAVEALYSMDGDYAPLKEIVELVERFFPEGNGHVIVDEAHSTGICGENGRGLVSMLGLENRITARLHTFGKALAASGAVLLTSPLIRTYLINYARTLIYTTALGHPALTSIETSFDMLENGTSTQLTNNLTFLFKTFISSIRPHLNLSNPKSIPPHLLSIPSSLFVSNAPTAPMIPVMTSQARPLAAFLNARGLIVRPITWPTVPKGLDRVRICLHSGNTVREVERLVEGLVEWAKSQMEMEGITTTTSRELFSSEVLAAKL